MGLFFLVLIAAVVLGVIGLLAEGLFWLLIVGAVILAVELVVLGLRRGSGRGLRSSR